MAASTNLTGSSAKGGNWDLELSVGKIETDAVKPDFYQSVLGFGGSDQNGDGSVDSLRLITWNVIGVDSNKPESQGPDIFMVGLRVDEDATGLNDLVVRIIDDYGSDVFGSGLSVGDEVGDFADSTDYIQLINRTEYTGELISKDS